MYFIISFIISFIIGGLIGFFIAACLGANHEANKEEPYTEALYTEDFLFTELSNFRSYWNEYLVDEKEKELVDEVIKDFMLGLMNGFERK